MTFGEGTMEDDRQREEDYLHFKNMNKEELIKLLILLDEDFINLKKIIQIKIQNRTI